MNINNQLQNELKKLKDFGLNPHDWKIEPIQRKIFRIINKADSSFILKGYFENQGWKKIWLQSI